MHFTLYIVTIEDIGRSSPVSFLLHLLLIDEPTPQSFLLHSIFLKNGLPVTDYISQHPLKLRKFMC